MPTTTLTTQGTVDSAALIVGDWSILGFEFGGTEYPLGNVPEGSLEVGREYFRHQGTQLPRRVDAVFLISTSMRFTGRIEELHTRNARFAMGQDPTPSSQYLYIGACEPAEFFTFNGRRFRSCDGEPIEFKIWKGLLVSSFELGGSDETNSTPFEIEAVDDQAGDFGGSLEAPLGYIWLPPPTP